MIEVVPSQTGEALEHVIVLCQEYVTWMSAEFRRHYPDANSNQIVSEHDYDDIRKKFPGEHVPPHGCLLLAVSDKYACGCVALGRLTNTVCEMRTLFVRPEFRGMGVAKKLVGAVLTEARAFGYRTMRLDTLRFMDSALGLYRSFGFYEVAPYRDISDSLKQYICFLELDLARSEA